MVMIRSQFLLGVLMGLTIVALLFLAL